MIAWDDGKRSGNLAKRGVDFAGIVDLDCASALFEIDDREDYRELREIAIGWLGSRLCFLVLVRRGDDEIRVVSFRKATRREVRRYAES